ncbi:MAG: transporter [Gammaproteobacteria bacterium]|jgi:hypothetical protein
MKYSFALAAFLFAALPAGAETIEELKTQLEAQKQINALQRQRIETLEAELAGRRIAPPARAEVAAPEIAADDPEADRALERALQRRGSVLLAPYVAEVSPSLFWSHTDNDVTNSKDDIYGAGLDARIGLPGGWMLGAGVPYLYRDIDDVGSNSGVGDVSATVWKSLFTQQGRRPSLVASLRYAAPTGDDIGDDDVPLGSGFHSVTARLSTVKTIDPIAFFGDLAYTHYFDDKISGVDVDRSDRIGFGLGANLAVTPDVSLGAGLDFAFEDDVEVNGTGVRDSSTTLGLVELTAGILLNRDVFLNFTGAFGITDDSPDVTLGMSLPIQF